MFFLYWLISAFSHLIWIPEKQKKNKSNNFVIISLKEREIINLMSFKVCHFIKVSIKIIKRAAIKKS